MFAWAFVGLLLTTLYRREQLTLVTPNYAVYGTV